MFSLDYDTICQIIERMGYTGVVEATIPTGKYRHGKIILHVQEGNIQKRLVITANKQEMTDAKRISHDLSKFSFLEWDLFPLTKISSSEEKHPSSLQPIPLSAATPERAAGEESHKFTPSAAAAFQTLSATSYPRRLPVDAARLNTWPFIHRQVYNLSTGQYSEQDMARFLRSAPADLLKVLKDLECMEVVLRGIARI